MEHRATPGQLVSGWMGPAAGGEAGSGPVVEWAAVVGDEVLPELYRKVLCG